MEQHLNIKITIGTQEIKTNYSDRKQAIKEKLLQLIDNNKEKEIKDYITNAINQINNTAEFCKQKYNDGQQIDVKLAFGLNFGHIIDQINLIDDCFYNNIISKENGDQLSRESRANCYTDLIDGIIIIVIHLNHLKEYFNQ